MTQTQTVHYDSKGRQVRKNVVSTREHSMFFSMPVATVFAVAAMVTALAYVLGHM